MVQTPEQILKDLKQKKVQSLYFLHGDEPYYLDKVVEALENKVVPESEKGFNQFILFGKDADIGTIVNSARRFPFMADRQLVLVKEAQQIGGITDKDKAKLLESYALHPLPSTVLVLCYHGNFDARKPLLKAFEKMGVVLHSKKLYDNKIPDWIAGYVRDQGVKVSPKAIQMLAEHIGNDLKRITSEIDKILLNLKIGEEISAAVVEKYVGVSKEYNVFELQKALALRQIAPANKIAHYLSANPKENPLPQILTVLYNFFSKTLLVQGTADRSEGNLAVALGVNPFFVKDYLGAARHYSVANLAQAIKAIRQADNAAKGIEGGAKSEADILRELVYSILH